MQNMHNIRTNADLMKHNAKMLSEDTQYHAKYKVIENVNCTVNNGGIMLMTGNYTNSFFLQGS